MKIWKYLRAEHIFLNILLPDKERVLRFVSDTCVRGGLVKNVATLYEGLKKREETMSTGIGGGIGFPHTTSREVKDANVLLIRLTEPIDFEALDALPVDIILALVIPENKTALHLQILAGVSRLCRNSEFLESVRQARYPKALRKEIRDLEERMTFH